MDKIVCLIESRQVLVYLSRAGRWCLQGAHLVADLPLVLRNLGSWKSTLHLLDLSATTQFKWEKVPEKLRWFEKVQWLREKSRQSRCEGDYWISTMSVRRSWIWFLKTAQSALPAWIEEKLCSQLGAMMYHNYALELVRSVKAYFSVAEDQFQCMILQRTDSPCIVAVYQGAVLKFLRLLSPMPQESVIYLIQETIRHVEEAFRVQNMTCVCFAECEAEDQALQHFLPQAQFFYGTRLERWVDQQGIAVVEQGYHTLDRLVLAFESRYQRLCTQKKFFFLHSIEQWLRKFVWVHAVALAGLGVMYGVQWNSTRKLQHQYETVCQQWNVLPWDYETFLRVSPQCLKNHHQYTNIHGFFRKLERITEKVSSLHKLEWTQDQARYWFDCLDSDSILQRSTLLSQWKQSMPSHMTLEWKETRPSTLLPETSEEGYFESPSPFSIAP